MLPIDKYNSEDDAFDRARGLLRNKLGLTEPATLELAEREALIAACDRAALTYSETHHFTKPTILQLTTCVGCIGCFLAIFSIGREPIASLI